MKKILMLTLIFVLALSLVSAERLPIVNNDLDAWGTILNNYLFIQPY